MPGIKEDLVEYGRKIWDAHLAVGAGGNISARDGQLAWMKPSGFAVNDVEPGDLCGLEIASGRQVEGPHNPTSEVNMHLAIYRNRPDAGAVFHLHPPWLCGVIGAGIDFATMPMFAEFIADLGGRATVPYILPSTEQLAQGVGEAAKQAETIFMANHGVCCLGVTMKQAFYRPMVAEDAAISLVAAKVVGNPQILSPAQEAELATLDGAQRRAKVLER